MLFRSGTWFLVLWLGVVGRFSRMFETQADMESVRRTGSGGRLAGALRRIVRMTGMDPEAPDFRHGSLARRLIKLDIATPDTADGFDRMVRAWSWSTLAGFIALWLLAALTG